MPTDWPHFEFNGYVTYLPTESYKYNLDVLFCQTETWVESNYLHLDWMNEYTAVQIQSGSKLNSTSTLKIKKLVLLSLVKV